MDLEKPLFSEQDKELIESLVFDTSLMPEFNAVSTCLYWDDELPGNISREGLKMVRILWMARGYVHQGLPFDDYKPGPEFIRRIWEKATEEVPDWPGFKRLVLNKKDKEYFTIFAWHWLWIKLVDQHVNMTQILNITQYLLLPYTIVLFCVALMLMY